MGAITDALLVPAKIGHPIVTGAGLRNATSTCTLGLSFFIAMIPAARALSWSLFWLANIVWLSGAAIMGILSFVRTPPQSTMVNGYSMAATAGMLFLPCFMRSVGACSGGVAVSGFVFVLCGFAL